MQGHLGETEIRIGETELLGFLAVAMSYELGGKTSAQCDRVHELGETDFSNEQTESWSGKLSEADCSFR